MKSEIWLKDNILVLDLIIFTVATYKEWVVIWDSSKLTRTRFDLNFGKHKHIRERICQIN